MSSQIQLFVAVGTVLMFFVALICRKKYALSLIKTVLMTLLLTVVGVAGVAFMFYIENGYFGGVSFFGAVFFVPPLLIPLALLLRVPVTAYLDISAPMISAMLAVMKINCLISGCCQGRILHTAASGEAVRFPSQIVELVLAAVIAVFLTVCIRNDLFKKRVYPLFMIVYGVTRFAMNFMRETNDFLFGMGIGNVWAAVSAVIGIVWLTAATLSLKGRENR